MPFAPEAASCDLAVSLNQIEFTISFGNSDKAVVTLENAKSSVITLRQISCINIYAAAAAWEKSALSQDILGLDKVITELVCGNCYSSF